MYSTEWRGIIIFRKGKRIAALMLSLVLLFTNLPAGQASAAEFTDIKSHWAKESIERAVELGLFSGMSETKFAPNGTLTRAMFVTVLASYSNYNPEQYKTSKFTDVKNSAWYAPSVTWAAEMGIVSGTSSGKFSPNQAISREQIAVMLVNYASAEESVLPRTRTAKSFEDEDKCASYALDSVLTLYCAGIVDGMNSKKYAPKATVTRAQCAVIMCNFIDACAGGCADSEKVVLVAHRGYSGLAPENTLAAYSLAAEKGYTYVEADVQFTKDNVPVLLHDGTINRTSDGSGYVREMTYEQLKQYDFGAWKAEEYAGTKIATFEEFLKTCAQHNLRPYIELKCLMTEEQIAMLVSMVKQYGMTGKVFWISFYYHNLVMVRDRLPSAGLMLIAEDVDNICIQNANKLKNGKNRITVSIRATNLTADKRAVCLRNNLHLGVWTVNDAAQVIRHANTMAVFVTTDWITYEHLYG